MLFLYLIFVLVLIALFSVVLFDTIRGKGRFGINFNPPDCPNCGAKLPSVRKPDSVRQALWGGWTCSACGCEMDKWGNAIINSDEADKVKKKIEQREEDFIKPFDESGKTPTEKIFEQDKE